MMDRVLDFGLSTKLRLLVSSFCKWPEFPNDNDLDCYCRFREAREKCSKPFRTPPQEHGILHTAPFALYIVEFEDPASGF